MMNDYSQKQLSYMNKPRLTNITEYPENEIETEAAFGNGEAALP